MTDGKSLKSRIDDAIKSADKDVIVERSFFDDISERLYVTIVKGSRKVEFILKPRGLASGDGEREIERVVKEALSRLSRAPIG
jgi:hypothetical protein